MAADFFISATYTPVAYIHTYIILFEQMKGADSSINTINKRTKFPVRRYYSHATNPLFTL